MTPETIIAKKMEQMGEMFQNPTMELFRAIFTNDCDYITFNGQHLKGVDENFRVHRQLAQLKIFRGAQLQTVSHQLKFLNTGTAVVIATGGIRFRWQKKLPQSRLSINTSVFIRQPDGDWKLASFQNSRIKGPGLLQRLFAKT